MKKGGSERSGKAKGGGSPGAVLGPTVKRVSSAVVGLGAKATEAGKEAITTVAERLRRVSDALQAALALDKATTPDTRAKMVERVRAAGQPFIAHLLKADPEKLAKEYAELKTEADHLPQEAFKANADRNRYKDIGCHDKSRVTLQEPSSSDVGETYDYIHASFVPGLVYGEKEYICTQGPMVETIDDFWKMVMEQRVCVIVILCRYKESGKEVCLEYVASSAGEEKATEAGTKVKTESVERTHVGGQELEERRLTLTYAGGGERKLLQLAYLNWPDRGLPPGGTASMVDLCGRLRLRHLELTAANQIPAAQSPRLIHCSAGIGRSGTLVAIDSGIARLSAPNLPNTARPLSVEELVRELRRHRRGSVQNLLQYLFIYLVLAEFVLALCTDLNTPVATRAVAALHAHIERLTRPASAASSSSLNL